MIDSCAHAAIFTSIARQLSLSTEAVQRCYLARASANSFEFVLRFNCDI